MLIGLDFQSDEFIRHSQEQAMSKVPNYGFAYSQNYHF